MNRRGRIGRSIRTADFRYTQWRDAKDNRLVAQELYDHRSDKTPGQLETKNVVSDPKMLNVVRRLSRRLHELVPHDVKVNR
jgi:iduronate 2-sulfatase